MTAASGTATNGSTGLSRDDLRRLQASLHELSECQRLLRSVLDERT
jgi:hypothetical protein